MSTKREVKFEGIVEAYGVGHITAVGPRIDGRDVIGEIDDLWPYFYNSVDKPQVRVYLGVEPVAEGRLLALHGFGGTEVTPPESPEITVGDLDLLERLNDLDGRTVSLVIEDA